MDIQNGESLHFWGPFVGSIHDFEIYVKWYELFANVYFQENESILADKTYISGARILTPIKKAKDQMTRDEKFFNQIIAKGRVIVENTFSRFKKYGILKYSFKNHLDKHTLILDVITKLITIELTFFPIYLHPHNVLFQ